MEPERGVARIAVLRANGLGDFIMALPALDALRAAYPHAQITLLGLDWHRAVVDGRPGPIDRVVPVPPYRGVRDEPGAAEEGEAIDRFFDAMRRERFDLAVQMHGGGRHSNPFVHRLGARLTIGLRTSDAAPLDRWVPYVFFQSEVLRYLEVVGLAGAPPVGFEPCFAVTDADRAEAARLVDESDAPLVVLHPGAGDPRRRWAAARFAAVGDALAGAGARVVMTGTGRERSVVRAVTDAMRAPAIDACDRLSIGGLAGLLARAAVVVSNDSGPLHLADAVGARTVGIYWCFNLITAAPMWRTRTRPLVSWQLACPVCGVDCIAGHCAHDASFVDWVPLEAVLEPALELLEQARRAGEPVSVPGR